ncbi:MAG: WD40/YVTN/BNR-like repeat-containing protein [Shewanella sp.]
MSFHTLRTSLSLGSLFIWLSTTSLTSAALESESGSTLRSQLQPLAPTSLLLDIEKVGNSLVAVGERGHVLVFNDSWQQAPTPTQSLLTKVSFISDTHGWAVGHDATIIHTQDGGKTWQVQRQSPEQEVPLLDVLFFNETQGVAIGAYGLFYRTEDGGKTWVNEFHQELLLVADRDYLAELKASDANAYDQEIMFMLPHFNRIIQLSDKRLLLVGERGLVAVSTDLGKTFTPLELGYEGSMFAVVEHGNQILVAGLRGHMFRADMSLANWQTVELPITSSINGLISDDKGGLYIMANAGNRVYLDANFKPQLLTGRQGESLIDMASDRLGQWWTVGSGGVVKTAAN